MSYATGASPLEDTWQTVALVDEYLDIKMQCLFVSCSGLFSRDAGEMIDAVVQ